MLGVAQLFAQANHIAIEKFLHARVDVLVLVPNDTHQLANDLRIGLPIEAVIRWSGLAEDLGERPMNCSSAGAIGPEKSAVDVEEDQTRAARNGERRVRCRSDHERVRRRPVMIEIAPAICHAVIDSPSTNRATSSANTGCRFEYIAVRVGPSTRTPLYQNR